MWGPLTFQNETTSLIYDFVTLDCYETKNYKVLAPYVSPIYDSAHKCLDIGREVRS